MEAPRLVAEALVEVPDLLTEALRPGERRPVAWVTAAIARAALPPEAADPPPPWLRPEQVPSFRRTVAALRGYGGAILADPVGSGKTFVALAVAAAIDSQPPTVVAPAILLPHWRGVTRELERPAALISHEMVSRGQVPPGRGPIIVDESHRFRSPLTRRYRTLAPTLIGRRTLLLSGTPVVNRMDDLAHQLLLAITDDALRTFGVPSIRRALARGEGPPALARLVISSPRAAGPLPVRREVVVEHWADDDADLARAAAMIGRLRLSRDRGVAALVRTGFLRALASSPAALLALVRRYGLLLHHARDAHAAHRHFSRAELRREAGLLPDQLVMWELLDDPGAPAELALSDEAGLNRLERHLRAWIERGDRKTALLRSLVADRRPTLVFTAWTDTVHYLRRGLRLGGAAWITGDRAGVDGCRYPRRTVIGAFDPRAEIAGGGLRQPPWLLVSTDVAAEGLNLQRVGRVIHYDLPWTSVRLEQRDGRALRRGSVHPDVSVVRFDPPPLLERQLDLGRRLARKAQLPGRVGIGLRAQGAWRWHQALERDWRAPEAARGWAAVPGESGRAIAAFAVDDGSGSPAGLVLVRGPDGAWRDDPAALVLGLEAARAGESLPFPAGDPPASAGETPSLEGLRVAVRRWLRAANGRHWLPIDPDPGLAAAIKVARERSALARRERRPLDAIVADRVLAFLSRGHTAGERMLAAGIAWGDPTAWKRAAALGERTAGERRPLGLVLTGLLVFVAGASDRNPGGNELEPAGSDHPGAPPVATATRPRGPATAWPARPDRLEAEPP